MSTEYLSAPLDETSRAALERGGLRFARLDRDDQVAFAAWFQAVNRGFLGSASPAEQVEQRRGYFTERRMSGVWDDSSADAATPVATIDVWTADLTLPGGSSIPAWAISAVSVAPTHRRRGIATALLESELRTASALGIPVAMLTVSESTIYGRFGFAPSALTRDLTIATKRARWTGPTVPGRVQFVTAEQLRVDGYELVERVRLATPGHMSYGGILWDRQIGLMLGDENAKKLRFVRYDDEHGAAQGFAIFSIDEKDPDFANHELTVHYLVTATDDAYAGLWRFLLEHDLVSKVSAPLRSVDEPLRWMIADFRAIHTDDTDHLWTRILDVKAALEARTYASPGRVVIAVSDPLGFAEGSWAIEVGTGGTATVTAVTSVAGPAEAWMTVNELAALYLGGVSASTLRAAGRITGETATLDAMFRSSVAPSLSIWF